MTRAVSRSIAILGANQIGQNDGSTQPGLIRRRRQTTAQRRPAPVRIRRQTVSIAIQTDPPLVSTSVGVQTNIPVDVWCICRKPDDGRKMIACENPQCKIEWFHMNCVGLTRSPKDDWFCANCRQFRSRFH